MALGVKLRSGSVDHLHVGTGFDVYAISDQGCKVRHLSQQTCAKPGDRQPHQRDTDGGKAKAGDEGQTGKLLGDLAKIDHQQHQQCCLRQRQQPAKDAAPDIVQHVDAVSPTLHRQQDVERRDHSEHDEAMRLPRFAEQRTQHQPVRQQERQEQPRQVSQEA